MQSIQWNDADEDDRSVVGAGQRGTKFVVRFRNGEADGVRKPFKRDTGPFEGLYTQSL